MATAPQVQLRRSSPYEARRALRNNTWNVLTIADPQAEISQQAVCGANSLTVTNYNAHCIIRVTFTSGPAWTCSSAKIAPNRLVTAGHCIYVKDQASTLEALHKANRIDPGAMPQYQPPHKSQQYRAPQSTMQSRCTCAFMDAQVACSCNRQHLPLPAAYNVVHLVILLLSQGGLAKHVDVYCTGQNVCGVARTTYGTNVITTKRYVTGTGPNAWDMAVIRTAATLPGTALVTGQVGLVDDHLMVHSICYMCTCMYCIYVCDDVNMSHCWRQCQVTPQPP